MKKLPQEYLYLVVEKFDQKPSTTAMIVWSRPPLKSLDYRLNLLSDGTINAQKYCWKKTVSRFSRSAQIPSCTIVHCVSAPFATQVSVHTSTLLKPECCPSPTITTENMTNVTVIVFFASFLSIVYTTRLQ